MKQAIKTDISVFFMKNAGFFITLCLLITPSVSNAGVFSLFTGWFESNIEEVVVLKDNNLNLQNMALLYTSINSSPNLAQGGGDIVIVDDSALSSETGPSGTMANIKEPSNSDRIATYIVREGDTLGQIAEMFGVSVGTIIWSNDIKQGDLIKNGQVLSILPISGVKHNVVKGETLASIVTKYKGDLKETRQYNDLLEDDTLAVGDEVVIPGGIDALPAPSSSAGSSLTQSILRNQLNVRGTNGPEYSGYYIKPISGGRISQDLHGYNAIDFAAPKGTPILAAASGEVIISKDNDYWNGGYGNYIVIKHNNGTQTLYAHNSSNIVWVGYHVVQGQVIGYLGSTGRSTGPHVHFEVRGAKNPFQ
ncbi:MAG: peptidoglycan DD-metalloendopeptidase family protein [Candidatus Pacebacteria bacterium]|nr:peptidoglycan DD-metalloendopeptidase family protein [Candidatus Paceibacterota bacterium]